MRRFSAKTRPAWMMRSMSLRCAVLATLFLISPLSLARAAITPIGDVEPSNPSSWGGTTTAYIGNTASGTLTVDGGSGLLSSSAYLGYGAGTRGLVSVSGTGSTWNAGGEIMVGASGTGTLAISGGAAITVANRVWVNVWGWGSGAIDFGSGGGTLTAKGVMAPWSSLTGTGVIKTNDS
jgi:T5SS/PEP-CTERM-associated repeat protein